MKNKYHFHIHFKYPRREIQSSLQTSGETLKDLKEALKHYDIDISWVRHVEFKEEGNDFRLMTPMEYFKAFGYRK